MRKRLRSGLTYSLSILTRAAPPEPGAGTKRMRNDLALSCALIALSNSSRGLAPDVTAPVVAGLAGAVPVPLVGEDPLQAAETSREQQSREMFNFTEYFI